MALKLVFKERKRVRRKPFILVTGCSHNKASKEISIVIIIKDGDLGVCNGLWHLYILHLSQTVKRPHQGRV